MVRVVLSVPFALLGVVVALIAAVKLSQVAAMYIQQAIEVDSRYMPLIALVK